MIDCHGCGGLFKPEASYFSDHVPVCKPAWLRYRELVFPDEAPLASDPILMREVESRVGRSLSAWNTQVIMKILRRRPIGEAFAFAASLPPGNH